MDRNEIRQAVIDALIDAHETTGDFMDMQPVADRLAVPFASVRSVIGELHERGFVQTFVGEAQAKLTAHGIDRLAHRDPAAPKGSEVNVVTVNGGIHGAAVSVGRAMASVTHQQSTLLQSLAQEIEQHTGIPPEQKKSWLRTLLEMSGHPIVGAILDKLRPG